VSFANAMLSRRFSETNFLLSHIMRHTNKGQELDESFFLSIKAFENNTYF